MENKKLKKLKKLLSLAFALATGALLLTGLAEARPFRVLLTSFDPFGGSSENNTQAIVSQMARMSERFGEQVEVQTCNLPVVYDEGARVAMGCIEKVRPDMVVSLGEAGCETLVETAATNWDSTPSLPDNAGQLRRGQQISAGGPSRSGFRFPVQAVVCGLELPKAGVRVSVSPGAFVCNNLAYHLSEDLGRQGIPFTFIHVPNSRCSPERRDPSRTANQLSAALAPAIVQLRTGGTSASPWPSSGNENRMPTDRDEAQSVLNALQENGAPTCEIDFVLRLLSSYPASYSLL